MKRICLFIGVIVGISACNSAPEKIQTKQEVITATQAKYHYKDSNNLFEIDLKYPVIDGNFDPNIVMDINNSIMSKFHSSVDKDSFIEAHQNLPIDLNEQNKDWNGVLTNTFEIHQSDSILFVSFSIYQYFLGAAHGFSSNSSIIFDLSNAKTLSPLDFIKNDKKSLTLLTNKFNSSLPDSICWGIESDTNIISHISNFYFKKDSVTFQIDDYELCPYAFSIPKMTFSNTELSSALKKSNFQTYFEIQPVTDEGEIASH
ncbi:MAG: PdaC/SigV domain-containing protein [Salibacteraceae bacterium]